MKECTSFEALLDLFVDGELFPEEMARVQSHLDQCPACRAYVDDALAIRAALDGWEKTPVPEDFHRHVMDAVRAHPRRRPTPWKKVVLPLAACFAVAILALPLRTQLLKSPQQTPVPAETPQATQSEVSEEETAPIMEADLVPDAEAPAQEDAAGQQLREAPDSSEAAENAAPAAQPPRMLTGENGAGSNSAPQTYLAANDLPQEDAPAAQEEIPPAADEPPVQDEPAGSGATVSAANLAQEPFATLTLTEAQAGNALEAYTPVEQRDGETVYHLDSAAYVQLKCALIATGSLPDTEELSEAAPSEDSEAFALVIVTSAS